MKRKIWNRFKDFLSEEGALIAYFNNTDAKRRDSMIRDGRYSFVTSAFVWSGVEEGHTYWRVIADKWEMILRKEFGIG